MRSNVYLYLPWVMLHDSTDTTVGVQKEGQSCNEMVVEIGGHSEQGQCVLFFHFVCVFNFLI